MEEERAEIHAEERLTPREREVLGLARRGYTNSEMADLLGISRNAVRFHLKEIHSKLGTGGERSRLARGWQGALGLLGLPLGKAAGVVSVGAVAAVLAGGAYLAYVLVPGEDVLAAPERFSGAVVVDGTPQPSTIVELSPADGSIVSVASTPSPDPLRPAGLCVQVRFVATPETGRWFRLYLDGVDVTAQSVWTVPVGAVTEKGRLCFAPAEGLSPGQRSAEVRVSNPGDPSAGLRESARWTFTVTP